MASIPRSTTDAPARPRFTSPAFASITRLDRSASSRSSCDDAAFASTVSSRVVSVGRTTSHSWRLSSVKGMNPPPSALTRSESPSALICGSLSLPWRASTLQSVPVAVETARSPQLKSSTTSASSSKVPSAARPSRSARRRSRCRARPGHPPRACPPGRRPRGRRAGSPTSANGVCDAMTDRPMTTSTTGHRRHAWRAASSVTSPAWIASATTPAVMRATPQKAKPRLTCICSGSPVRVANDSADAGFAKPAGDGHLLDSGEAAVVDSAGTTDRSRRCPRVSGDQPNQHRGANGRQCISASAPSTRRDSRLPAVESTGDLCPGRGKCNGGRTAEQTPRAVGRIGSTVFCCPTGHHESRGPRATGRGSLNVQAQRTASNGTRR